MNSWSDSVSAARLANTSKTPGHGLNTDYRYNTLNQVVAQLSPDGGQSAFWYDRLGRLALSQNAKQKAASGTENNRLYSYTLYDHLGRITEVGEIKNATTDPLTDLVTRSPLSLEDWLLNSAANTSQITQTIYDEAYPGFEELDPPPFYQDNLRNRVSYTSFTAGNNPANYNQATFYTYDIHGNVQSLLQDYGRDDVASTHNIMNAGFNRFKRMDYDYDLISGKVNAMYYEFGQKDGFGHRYEYDAENRLTTVKTSWNDRLWETDATYEYYKHGPLARMTLGAQKVQGIDYAYTLQGWLKGVNSTALLANRDMGQDGQGAAANQFVAKDAYSFSLNYFTGDYAAISSQSPFPGYSGFLPTNYYRPLFNGNISSMTESLEKMGNGSFFGGKTMFYNYSYDQLNRITGMDVLKGINTAGDWDSTNMMAVDQYKERVAYDPNGNIKQYLRHGNLTGGNLVMDSLQYEYYDNKNQLRHVTESVPNNRYTSYTDLDLQTVANNYEYDAIGNLKKDSSEGITDIKWSVYGKILEITRSPRDNPVKKITYAYDAQGNRISSITEKSGTDDKDYTWYVRDAQGNTIAVYQATTEDEDLHWQNLNQTERHIYGSSRIGTYNLVNSVRGGAERVELGADDYRGYKRYELTNHLGNVLATISDKKFGVVSDTNSSLIASYLPEIQSSNSYYPFGSMMPGRMFSSGEYRYGFNGKENDNEVKGGVGTQQDYGMRIYDPRVGRFLSTDPLQKKFAYYTPYQYTGNKPIWCVDIDGLEDLPSTALKKYGEKQVHQISTTMYIGEGWPQSSTQKVVPQYAQPATKGMTDVQVYQLAFNRYAEPGKTIVKSNQYIDERLMKAEQQVGYFYTHNVPGWSKSESATRMIHAINTATLFSGNEEYAKTAVEQIKIVDDWDYNISWTNLALSANPVKAYQNINKGLARLSRVVNRSASLATKGFQSGWASADLAGTMDNLLGKDFSKVGFEATETGKVIWSNEQTGVKVIQDPLNRYFRVQNKDGHYVGADGNQIKIPGNLKGKEAKDYLQKNTHFTY